MRDLICDVINYYASSFATGKIKCLTRYSKAAILRHVCRVWFYDSSKYIYIRHICDSGARCV